MIVNTRDAWGVAMKATYGQFGDKELMIYKDPKTDTDNLKKSHKGLIFVERDGDNFKATDGFLYDTYYEYAQTHESAMRAVFIEGKMVNRESFTTIRERLANEK
jgi:nicotinamide phosphoribosyltransferase